MMGAERAAEGKGGAHTAAALPALGLGVFFQSAFVNAEGEVYTKVAPRPLVGCLQWSGPITGRICKKMLRTKLK